MKRPSPLAKEATVIPVNNSIKERTMRKTLRASVLIFALCGTAFAGDISNPSAPQPPPPSGLTAEERATDSEMQTGATDSLTETLLSALETALESVLALS